MFPNPNTPKNAGKLAIKQATEYLMLSNGETTALAVFHLLQQQGYTTTQSDVHWWMDQLCEELDWEYSFNGHARSYLYRLEMKSGLRGDIPAFSMN